MKKHQLFLISIIIITSCAFHGICCAQDIKHDEFKFRRLNILSKLDSVSMVVMKSGNFVMRSADTEYPYHQESSLFYLTGITYPNHCLIISPIGINVNNKKCFIILFIPNQKKDSVYKNNTSNEAVVNSDKFNTFLKPMLKSSKKLYVNSPDIPFVYDWLNDKNNFIERNSWKTLEANYPGLKVKSTGDLVFPLREIKSASEVELIKKAISITEKGIMNAVKVCKPGVWEYELRAELEYEMIRDGAVNAAFPSIVGSGINSLSLHYFDDNKQTKENDVVVIDAGAEYNGYAADITRTIPVSGKFTPAQREVYNAVLEAQKKVIDIIKPGITFDSLTKKADEIIKKRGFGKFIKHEISHSLGNDVHDPRPSDSLKAGMVIAVEPGIYIPVDAENISKDYKGFGIRIEDDVLITENGCRMLSNGFPREIEEIENIMKNNLN